MSRSILCCPNCDHVYLSDVRGEYEMCMMCNANYTVAAATKAYLEKHNIATDSTEARTEAVIEAEDMFLSGSSFLALRKYDEAAELFLSAAKLCPSSAKYWLYLLAAITERFRLIHVFADEKAIRKVGSRKVSCKNVYKNFVSTAKKDDYIFAKSEFGVDLDPVTGELWEFVLMQIIRKNDLPFDLLKAAELAAFAAQRLAAINEKTAMRYYDALCKRLNPVKEGVLEVNSLMFYPESPNGVLKIDTDADMIEFASDDMPGAERYKAFLLTRNVENIGTHFPFRELVVDKDVTKIPDKLMNFCGGIQRPTLSSSVKVIGREAFTSCVNLCHVSSLEGIEEIGEKAFFGTGIRILELSSACRYVGREVLGIKKSLSDSCEIHKYLIKLDERAAAGSPGFNTVGEHKCGYLLRKDGELKLVYPVKSVGGETKSLSGNEKMMFKALAYASADDEERSKATSFRTCLIKPRDFLAVCSKRNKNTQFPIAG